MNEKRTIRIYKPCELCEGTGLEQIEGYTSDCRNCLGHGDTLEKVYKDVNMDELELPTGNI